MLEEDPLFHAAAVRSAERVPTGLHSLVLLWAILFYWLLETSTQQMT